MIDIAGMSRTRKTFIVGFAFMNEDVTDAYIEVLQFVRDVYTEMISIPSPLTTSMALMSSRSLSVSVSEASKVSVSVACCGLEVWRGPVSLQVQGSV
jgi:hypothetical protein